MFVFLKKGKRRILNFFVYSKWVEKRIICSEYAGINSRYGRNYKFNIINIYICITMKNRFVLNVVIVNSISYFRLVYKS